MEITTSITTTWRSARLAALALGPFVSLWATRQYLAPHVTPLEWALLDVVVFVAWSPLYFSVPALLCQHDRDAALPHLDGLLGSLWRGVVLIPYLLSNRSPVRTETAVSLVSWVLIGAAAMPSLVTVISQLL